MSREWADMPKVFLGTPVWFNGTGTGWTEFFVFSLHRDWPNFSQTWYSVNMPCLGWVTWNKADLMICYKSSGHKKLCKFYMEIWGNFMVNKQKTIKSSKCVLRNSNSLLFRECVRNAESQAPPPNLLNQNVLFHKIPRWFSCTAVREKHRPRNHAWELLSGIKLWLPTVGIWCPLFSILWFLFPFLTFSPSISWNHQLNKLLSQESLFQGLLWQKPKLRHSVSSVLESILCICFNQLVLDSMLTQLFGIQVFQEFFYLFYSFLFYSWISPVHTQIIISTLVQFHSINRWSARRTNAATSHCHPIVNGLCSTNCKLSQEVPGGAMSTFFPSLTFTLVTKKQTKHNYWIWRVKWVFMWNLPIHSFFLYSSLLEKLYIHKTMSKWRRRTSIIKRVFIEMFLNSPKSRSSLRSCNALVPEAKSVFPNYPESWNHCSSEQTWKY